MLDYTQLLAYLNNPNPGSTTPHEMEGRARETVATDRFRRTKDGYVDITIGMDWAEQWRCKKMIPSLEMYVIAEASFIKEIGRSNYKPGKMDRGWWGRTPELPEDCRDYYCDDKEPWCWPEDKFLEIARERCIEQLYQRHWASAREYSWWSEDCEPLKLASGRIIGRAPLLATVWEITNSEIAAVAETTVAP